MVAILLDPSPRLTKTTVVLGPDSIVGSYRILQQIGCGGMGAVFEAIHTLLPRHVAIKVLHPQLRGHPGVDLRMVQEASILDRLRHPGIVRVFDCGLLVDGRPWIAMELLAGESLAAKLARETTLPPVEVCNLVAALAEVLATVHLRGIIHRDLKPDNVLFADAESGFPLRIIDWGVARLGPTARLTLDGVTCGTPIYMSPEQAAGRNIAPPCDIYSLGVMAYEALVGHPPFDGRTLAEVVALHMHGEAAPLSELCPVAPRALCDLVHRMLHKVPLYRPTATEVRRAMQELGTASTDHPDGTCSPVDAYASYELTTAPWTALTLLAVQEPAAIQYGTLEPTTRIRRLRWTPELPASIPGRVRSQVSGEILRKH